MQINQSNDNKNEKYDVVILGGGAAGLSAGLYSTRAMLSTLVLESVGYGGQVLVTDVIENYPGFPEGVKGPELSVLMEEQTRKFGAIMKFEEVIGIEQIEDPIKLIHTSEATYEARTIIIATGGSHRKLQVPGEDEFSGKGVSYCAVCDGNFFRNEKVVVVGGGDAALDEGTYLSGIVDQVTIIHRRDELRASKILQERAFANPKIDFIWSHIVEGFEGNGILQSVKLRNLKTDEVFSVPTAGAFIYIGFDSNSGFLNGQVPVDEFGHIYANGQMETSLPGIFACGDIRVGSDKQLGGAVGDGITAALAAYRYLAE